MIELLLTNFSIIFTFTLFIFWPVFHEDKNQLFKRFSKRQYDVLIGLHIGIIGILLGYVSLEYFSGALYNARMILILFSGLLGGPITILLSGLIMNIGRLLIFPASELSIILTINSIALVFVYAFFAYKYRIHFKNIHLYLYFSLLEVAIIILFYFNFTIYAIGLVMLITSFTMITFWAVYWIVYQSRLTSNQAREMMALKQVDYLTQLPNNYAIEVYLQSMFQHNSHFSLMHIDIDRFKQYNNQYSYLIGDSMLKEVATIIKTFGKGKDAFVGRIGGQEFCYILNHAAPAIAIHEANELRQLIEGHVFGREHGLELSITISIGISSMPGNGATPEQLFVNADKALQASKKTRFNQVYHYNQYVKDLEFSRL